MSCPTMGSRNCPRQAAKSFILQRSRRSPRSAIRRPVHVGAGIMLRWIALAAVVLAGPALAQDVSKDPSQAPRGSYRLEARHSQLLFAIGHAGLTGFHGRFDKLSGSLDFNPNQPEKSDVDVTIDMTSEPESLSKRPWNSV